ncbi:hypothetical protein BYT27DRAFT_6766939 [Phlegmacium glaucopus]|nr:hypothetical protein BYT27DRAFT_6766939 [Phlegmacium glaucopus]
MWIAKFISAGRNFIRRTRPSVLQVLFLSLSFVMTSSTGQTFTQMPPVQKVSSWSSDKPFCSFEPSYSSSSSYYFADEKMVGNI